MSLISDIQNESVQPNSDLGTILRKCKLLAARLHSKPLEEWLLFEANGYPPDAVTPDYRRWPLSIRGDFSGPFGSGLRNAPIPTICIPERFRERATTFVCRQSVATIQQMLAENNAAHFQADTGDLAVVLGMNVFGGQNCIVTYADFGRAYLLEVVNSVRNRILDFAIAIEKDVPSAGTGPAGTDPTTREVVSQIFHTTIMGGNVSIVGSSDNASVTFSVKQGDVQELRRKLDELGIGKEEVRELEEAIKSDDLPTAAAKLGPNVSKWIGSVLGRAASGAYKIGIDVGGKVISHLIATYYGLTK